MKQLTKEQQQEMLKMIEHLSKEDALMNKDYYIDKAKAFLQSLKPKIYVCQNRCGQFYFIDNVGDPVPLEEDALKFETVEDAQNFIVENKINSHLTYVIVE